MAQSNPTNGQGSAYAPTLVLKKIGVVPPSALVRRPVAGPYSLSTVPAVASPKKARRDTCRGDGA